MSIKKTRAFLWLGIVSVICYYFYLIAIESKNTYTFNIMPTTDQQHLTPYQEKLIQLSQEILKKTEENLPQNVSILLDLFGETLLQIKMEGMTSIEGLQAFMTLITEAKRTFHAVSYQANKGKIIATRILYATDALIEQQHPKWLQLENQLHRDLKNVELGIREKALDQAKSHHKLFSSHLHLIHTAIQLDRSPSMNEKLDSQMKLLSHQIEQLDASANKLNALKNLLEMMHQTLDEIFHKQQDKSTYLPEIGTNPIRYTTFMIGGIILSILILTAYRMLTYNDGVVKVKRNNLYLFIV